MRRPCWTHAGSTTLDFVKVTESAALAASRWMGRGERDTADGAAVEAMRDALDDMEIAGRIVIGEGERDEAPMLFIGEELGRGGYEVDIAVDPVEGTNLVANGLPNSIAVMAIAERGGLLHAPDSYMQEARGRPEGRAVRAHRRAGRARISKRSRTRSNGRSTTSRVVILDRPRHADLIDDVRAAGARIKLISDGDVDAASRPRSKSPASTSRWASAARPKACWRRPRSNAWAANFMGRLKPRNDEEAERAEGDGFRRPRPRARHRRSREERRRRLLRDRHHRRRSRARRALLRQSSAHALDPRSLRAERCDSSRSSIGSARARPRR